MSGKKIVVTLGVFDGVHRGHQSIFQKVIRRAERLSGIGLAYTFDPHPAQVLAPESAPPMIMTLRQRIEAIRQSGIDRVVVQRFTRHFSKISPRQFFDQVLCRRLRASEIFVGYNFTFGHHRTGTTELLERLGKAHGIPVTIVDSFLWKETLVSSTQIRSLLSHGQVARARELLGHSYRMEGTVIRGRGVGGRLLATHTANLKSENERILPCGVYSTFTHVGRRRFPSVTNIGPNPTFGLREISIETHLLHFRRKILGQKIQIEFLEKIREEIAFQSTQDLAEQIQHDIQIAQRHHRSWA